MASFSACLRPSGGPGGHSPGAPGVGASASARAAMQTGAGHVVIAADDPSGIVAGEGFIAAWDDATAPSVPSDVASVRALRPGSLVLATADGLDLERGPFGGRPLYYARGRGGVVVSSRLERVVAALEPRPALDPETLGACGLDMTAPDPRATVYRGVRRLLPCETVRFGADGTVRSSSRTPQLGSRLGAGPEECAEAMRAVLQAVVARQLRPHAAAVVEAGGGLDSSALLAVVARQARQTGAPRFSGLTMDFAGPGDDRPHMAALLRHLDASTLRVSPRDIGPARPSWFCQDAAPCTWVTGPIGLLAAERARAWGATVTMSGAFGDLVLDGDLRSFGEELRRGRVTALLDAARLQMPWSRSRFTQVVQLTVRPLLMPWLPTSWLDTRRRRWLASQEMARWAGPRSRPLLGAVFVDEARHGDRFTELAVSPLLGRAVDCLGQGEAVWGVSAVTPYLAPELIALVESLPPEHLFLDHRSRGLFRRAMTGLLPESVRLRMDKASFEPLGDLTFAAAGGFAGLRDLLTMKRTADLGLVEPREFRATCERVVRGAPTTRGWLEVWPMLAVEGFLESVDAARAPA